MFTFPPRSFRTRKAPGSRDRSHPWGVCQSRPSFVNFLLLPVWKNYWTDQTFRSWLVLACSAGIFFRYANFICSRKCLVETPKERKKWASQKAWEGRGERKENGLFFLPFPSPFSFFRSFALAATQGLLFLLSPQSSSVIHESKMAFQRWRNQETPWCQSLILEKWMNFEKKQFFFLDLLFQFRALCFNLRAKGVYCFLN